MNYEIFGPFQVPRDGRLTTRDAKRRKAVWTTGNEEVEDLSDACGCYLSLQTRVSLSLTVATTSCW